MEAINNFLTSTGFYLFTQGDNWKCLVMIAISCVLLFLGIKKKFEPLLLVPIAIGMLVTNLPDAGMYHEILFAGGHVHWDLFQGGVVTPEFIAEMQALGVSDAVLGTVAVGSTVSVGLIDVLYLGIKLGIYPCLIFMGVGSMTDFGPLIANPKSLLLGAAAQLGIFITFIGCRLMGFSGAEASSVGIIGGADGPTAILTTTRLAPRLLGAIAIAAYSYMALIPLIQPPFMRALTTPKERQIKMVQTRAVSKTEKIIFPIVVTIFVVMLLPDTAPLIGCLMLGNLFKECGVTDRLSDTVQNALMNIVTILLSTAVGATMVGSNFLTTETLSIVVLGVCAFILSTVGGLLGGKVMCALTHGKVNPLIGSAGVSAVPMAARVANVEGQKANPSNFLLMHAMGPNVAGVIGSAIAAGFLLKVFGA